MAKLSRRPGSNQLALWSRYELWTRTTRALKPITARPVSGFLRLVKCTIALVFGLEISKQRALDTLAQPGHGAGGVVGGNDVGDGARTGRFGCLIGSGSIKFGVVDGIANFSQDDGTLAVF